MIKKTIERECGVLMLIGDIHYGLKTMQETLLHAHLNYLKQHPYVQYGLMGDIFNCASLTRHITDERLGDIDDQMSAFLGDLRPVRDQCKFSLWGNHEERIAREAKTTRFFRTIFRDELGAKDVVVPDPQRGLFLNIHVGDLSYGSHAIHSLTSARVNMDLVLKRMGFANNVSVLFQGHTHKLLFKPRTFSTLQDIGKGYATTLMLRQYLVSTGSFAGYPSYAESRGYQYEESGAPIIKFYADNYEIGYSDLTTTYRHYIERDSAGAGIKTYIHGDSELTQIMDTMPRQLANGKFASPPCTLKKKYFG